MNKLEELTLELNGRVEDVACINKGLSLLDVHRKSIVDLSNAGLLSEPNVTRMIEDVEVNIQRLTQKHAHAVMLRERADDIIQEYKSEITRLAREICERVSKDDIQFIIDNPETFKELYS